MPQNSDKPLFIERHAAGQSLKNAWTRLASTHGCLYIVLFPDMLSIKPHWYAKWLISLLCLDLIHDIPTSRIKGVTVIGSWFGYGKVEVRSETVKGGDQIILLYLKKYREFVRQAERAANR